MTEPIRQIKTFLGVSDFVQLFPPPKTGTYTYFEGADKYPFNPKASGHSLINAWWMAEYSLLAYAAPAEVEQVLHQLFATQKQESQFFWLDSATSNTQGFGVETTDYVLITFRGTEFPRPSYVVEHPKELRNILADIGIDIKQLTPQIISQHVPVFDTPVHPGFAEALQSVWQTLQKQLATFGTKPIWLTGHSLGGAIATLLAYQLPTRVAALYTFGSPCVGTTAFAQTFKSKGLQEKAFRYLHGDDAVAKAFELLKMDYQHVGQLFSLAARKHGLLEQVLSDVVDTTVGLNQLDHVPILYSYECWNSLP
jgi:predicted lipase